MHLSVDNKNVFLTYRDYSLPIVKQLPTLLLLLINGGRFFTIYVRYCHLLEGVAIDLPLGMVQLRKEAYESNCLPVRIACVTLDELTFRKDSDEVSFLDYRNVRPKSRQ